MNFQIKLSYA